MPNVVTLIPHEHITPQILDSLRLIIERNKPLRNVIPYLSVFSSLTSEEVNIIIKLLHECTENNIEFKIIKASPTVTKLLVYSSLEFPEVVELQTMGCDLKRNNSTEYF